MSHPLPFHVGLNSLGTESLGVSTATKKSRRAMDPMAMMTAKSEMKFLHEAGKNGVVLAFLRKKAIRKVPKNRRMLIRNALGTGWQLGACFPSTT